MAETASSNMSDYVRADVFNARMDRLEAIMEKHVLEMRADNERLRSETRADIEKLRSETKAGIEKLSNETKAGIEDLRSETMTENTSLNGEIRVISARLDSLETTVYWGFAIIAFILAFSAFVPAITEFFRSLRKPSVTLEDVERIVNAAISQSKLKEKNPL